MFKIERNRDLASLEVERFHDGIFLRAHNAFTVFDHFNLPGYLLGRGGCRRLLHVGRSPYGGYAAFQRCVEGIGSREDCGPQNRPADSGSDEDDHNRGDLSGHGILLSSF